MHICFDLFKHIHLFCIRYSVFVSIFFLEMLLLTFGIAVNIFEKIYIMQKMCYGTSVVILRMK